VAITEAHARVRGQGQNEGEGRCNNQPLGAALVKWPKYFFLLITMKLASLVEIALLIIYHQGTKKNFDRKVLVFCTTCRKISI
jgi:hypothetical protein